MARAPSPFPEADARFWSPYRAVAARYAHEIRLIRTVGRQEAEFDLPPTPWGVSGVPAARLWHDLSHAFVAIDAMGFEHPLRIMAASRNETPIATCTQDLPGGGVRFRLLVPRLDFSRPLGEQENEVRHAMLQALSLKRWWRTMQGNWARWREVAGSAAPMLEARRLPAHHTWKLRQQVLRPHQDIREMAWPGDADDTTVHFGVYADGVLLAVASLFRAEFPAPGSRPGLSYAFTGPCTQLRGMATDPEARGRGLGMGLLKWCLEHARRHGESVFWCNARTSAVPFYEKGGLRVVSDEFDLPDAGPHVVMVHEFERDNAPA
ncbi:MAG: hypothetical protein HBSAPP03_17970 [Phycisphaerae bacterium]|nr:MAG: hypothetical protein HBSAPP03_17970 [Phycisphaerae bacterium]